MDTSKTGLITSLKAFGRLLEVTGANPFRSRALENGARTLEGLTGEPAEWLTSGALKGLKGVGKGLVAYIEEWAESGAIAEYDALREEVPEGVVAMLSIPGMGPKKVRAVWKEAGIDSLAGLKKAAEEGTLASLGGFGAKTCEKILAGIEQREKYAERHLASEAREAADAIIARLEALARVKKISLAGSLRRGLETVKDIDLIVTSDAPQSVMDTFVALPGIERVVAHGTTKSSILLEGGLGVDLRVVEAGQFAAAQQYFTGSKEHNTQLRSRAKAQGLRLNEYGLFREPESGEFDLATATALETPTEAEIYKHLGLACPEPELREGRGEIEAAERGDLPGSKGGPRLIEARDMRGVLHCHTTYSDGKNTLREMVEACRSLGYKYFAVCDHSQTAAYAGGLRPEALMKQAREVDALNEELDDFTVFKGIESDILGDGQLDYDDKILASFDLVVVSIHSQMQMDRATMTDRICRALEHPAACILAHPTGRLLCRREGYQVDLEKVFKVAAAHDVAIEINANPHRLDLDWRQITAARRAGCRFAINPDAHNTNGIKDIRYGVAIARKGWLASDEVVNTMQPEQFRDWLRSRKSS